MSDTLKGVIIGAIVAGGFLIVAQVLNAVFQAKAATVDWTRKQRAQRYAELESMCVEILRYIQEIQHAVVNLEDGRTNLTADQFIDTVNAAGRAVMLSGCSLIVRKGPDDPTPPLIGRVVDEARTFSALYHVDRKPPATKDEKRQQMLVVVDAATALRTHIHAMVKAEAEI